MKATLALLVVALCVSLTGQAEASSCAPSTFAQRLTRADVVFVGTARSIDADLATTFVVERVHKGVVPPRVVVHTDRNKYAMLPAPSRFLVYAKIRSSSGNSNAQELYVETCGGSAQFSAATGDVAQLGKGTPPSTHGAKVPEADASLPADPDNATDLPHAGPDASSVATLDADASETSATPTTLGASHSTPDPAHGPATQTPPVAPATGCRACEIGRPAATRRLDWLWLSMAALGVALHRRSL